jgi:hypothetical protein
MPKPVRQVITVPQKNTDPAALLVEISVSRANATNPATMAMRLIVV